MILYDLLRPFAERNVIIAEAIAYLGPIAYFLALLATTLEQWDLAAASH